MIDPGDEFCLNGKYYAVVNHIDPIKKTAGFIFRKGGPYGKGSFLGKRDISLFSTRKTLLTIAERLDNDNNN